MRRERCARVLAEGFGDVWLVFEDVQPDGAQAIFLQSLDHGRLINNRAPAHVDQHALRPQRLHDVGVDEVARLRPARRHADEGLDLFRHVPQVRAEGKGHVLL